MPGNDWVLWHPLMAPARFGPLCVDVNAQSKNSRPRPEIKMGQGKNARKMAAGYLMPVNGRRLILGPTIERPGDD